MFFLETGSGAWENIKNIFGAILNQIGNKFSTIFNIIKNNVVTWASTVGNVISGAFKAVVNRSTRSSRKYFKFANKSNKRFDRCYQ